MAQETSKTVIIDGKTFVLSTPSIQASSFADMEYAKAYTKALQGGLLPKVALEKIMRDTGGWTEEDDTKVNDLLFDLQQLMLAYSSTEDGPTKESIKLEFVSKKQELSNISNQQQQVFNNSAEQKAEEARIGALAWQCILDESGKKIWANHAEFIGQPNTKEITTLLKGLIGFIGNVDLNDNLLSELSALDELKKNAKLEKEAENKEVKTTEVKTEEAVVVAS